uniref:RING zinc finger family protein n=1 Tax=Rhizophora mucronata TaxID=61149 RepID=A0A2P2KVP6_RHIMU
MITVQYGFSCCVWATMQTENFSIIYGYDGVSFQQHYINRKFNKGLFFSKAHKYRLKCYYTQPGILNNTVNVSRYWKSRKYLHPNRWLESWVRREIQALTQEEDVNVIVHHILGVVDSFLRGCDRSDKPKPPESKREEFRAAVSVAVRPFIAARTERFVNELELFLASGLNTEAYDEVYLQQLGWTTPAATSTHQAAGGESIECTPVVPYLYIFDEDPDETD